MAAARAARREGSTTHVTRARGRSGPGAAAVAAVAALVVVVAESRRR